MSNNQEKIDQLIAQLEWLIQRQDSISKETTEIHNELRELKKASSLDKKVEPIANKPEKPEIASKSNAVVVKEPLPETPSIQTIAPPVTDKTAKFLLPKAKKSKIAKGDFEKFIGENLINKIGIGILIFGVAIGAKYSIEHDLISPLTRIVLGYLTSLGLLGFGIKLKKKYHNYSAVLVSGAIAIMYFLTFASYSFYELIPQTVAFVSMLILTIFTVVSAINYNKQIIAHIGLVGAYAVPFLLSNNSGNVTVLFSYISIINVGILVLSFRKYWKPLYYSSFILTWIIYASWYLISYKQAEHFQLALVFLFLFFSTFYAIFLAYKLWKNEKFNYGDIVLLLSNSFLFYGLGYAILNGHLLGSELLGLFTLINAILHFAVSAIIFKKKLADRNLLYLISGLVLVFVTMVFPVQLDGNWVTLFWVGEALLLFWIGRTKQTYFFEQLSYPLMLLASVSLLQDWMMIYDRYYYDAPDSAPMIILNVNFLSSMISIAFFGWIYKLSLNEKYVSEKINKEIQQSFFKIGIPLFLTFLIYAIFRIEIVSYFNQLVVDSRLYHNALDTSQGFNTNQDISHFKTIWTINYSLFFLSIMSFFSMKKGNSKALGELSMLGMMLGLVVFLVQGLLSISELRDSYISPDAWYPDPSIFNILIRYISYGFVALTLTVCYRYIKQEFTFVKHKMAFDILLHSTVLWIASSELIHWMDLAHSTQSYKLGLSILWGVYSLFLIILGINKKKKHLRIGALVIFAITLLKLFFYDIMDLGTIAKTIVFVSLGVLLLIISFLYNKYKHRIAEPDEE